MLPYVLLVCLALDPAAFEAWQTDIDRFEPAIQQFEELDRTQEYPDDAVLFVGSSSIRKWDAIADDMQPYNVIQRGYGGAKFSDLAYFADRIISPHEYQALVIFVGNDVSGSDRDKQPEETVKFFKHVLGVVRAKKPQVPVFLIEITPTASRWQVWPEIQATNAALRSVCDAEPHTYFVSTADAYLNDEGQPRTELFVDDKLHQNRDGYRLWASIIKPVLADVLHPGAAR